MACSCAKKAQMLERYDHERTGKPYNEKGDRKKLNPFMKILQILMQICFGILCSAVIIIMIVPMLLYIFICLITGRQAHFTIKNFLKKGN